MSAKEVSEELEQAIRHVGRLKRTAQMLLESVEDVEADLVRMAEKTVAGYQQGLESPQGGGLAAALTKELRPDYPATDAATAQASWIRLAGRQSRTDMRSWYEAKRQLVIDAATLPELERANLRGGLMREVDRYRASIGRLAAP